MEFTSIPLDQTKEEYDGFFRSDPLRWDDSKKDRYALDLIALYLWATKQDAPKTMLDVGCGSGHTIEYFSHTWPGTKMHGLDLSDVAIEFAEKRVPQGQFTADSLEDVILTRTFELVTLMGVLEHFPDPARALGKIRELLSPNGIVYVEVPNCIAYARSERFEGFRPSNTKNKQWEWHLFRESWEEIIRSAGFCINLAIKGPRLGIEFIWILTRQKESLPVFRLLRTRAYERLILARAHSPNVKYIHRLYNVLVGGLLRVVEL
jgi:SAM-dependent methyltransferase